MMMIVMHLVLMDLYTAPLPSATAVQDGLHAHVATYNNAWHAARVMYKTEGPLAFYKGLTPSLMGSGQCTRACAC